VEEPKFLILGGGLAGLTAAWQLGNDAVVLEQSERPGGLVKTHRFGDYWFDSVIHILHFDNPDTKLFIQELMGDGLSQCPPEAFIETGAGTARFPIQFHLGDIDKDTTATILGELKSLQSLKKAENFRDWLLGTFGSTLCDIFFFPYNRKLWKRDLASLAPGGFTWNIQPTSYKLALESTTSPGSSVPGYNSDGWYPRTPIDSEQRGIEILIRTLVSKVPNIRTLTNVTEIDTENKIVRTVHNGEETLFSWSEGGISTIPLPAFLGICRQTPDALKLKLNHLVHNRVTSVMLSVKGPRPENSGHWRYYPEESLIFTRLVFMHEFDRYMAPPDGWGLMAEILEPAENPLIPADELIRRTRDDIAKVGFPGAGSGIIDSRVVVTDPAYVVFSRVNWDIISEARAFLESEGITLLGRFGNWTYQSMSQVIQESTRQARKMAGGDRAGN